MFYYEAGETLWDQGLLTFWLWLEARLDDLDEDLMLKAPVMFGSRPYFDIRVNDPMNGGSVSLPGVPANRAYLVHVEMFHPGEEDDADPRYETVVWLPQELDGRDDPFRDVVEPYFSLVSGSPTAYTVHEIWDYFQNTVLPAYLDRDTYPLIAPVFVRDGRTATVQLILREFPAEEY